jgi:hypothetical protein
VNVEVDSLHVKRIGIEDVVGYIYIVSSFCVLFAELII